MNKNNQKELISLNIIAGKVKVVMGESPNFMQLERNTGVDRHMIKNIYNGSRNYTIASLIKLCNELKIDLLK